MIERKKHAEVAPSSANKWLHCPPSSRLEIDYIKKYGEMSNENAEEGEIAHLLAEGYLKIEYDQITKPEYDSIFETVKTSEHFNTEMDEYIKEYMGYIADLTEQSSVIQIEKKIDLNWLIPECFGTVDCIVLNPDYLHIVDLKYGKGVKVDAQESGQLKLYALGVAKELEFIFDIDKIKLHIYQPRIDNISVYETTIEELEQINFKELGELAYSGKGELKTGKHCQFCKNKPICKKQKENFTNILTDMKDIYRLTVDEIAEILPKLDEVEAWIKSLKAHALKTALSGTKYKGFKLVEGRKTRAFKDEHIVLDKLIEAGTDEALLYERKMLTLTNIEKLIGKKQFNDILKDEITYKTASPSLVPDTDARKEYSSVESDFMEVI